MAHGKHNRFSGRGWADGTTSLSTRAIILLGTVALTLPPSMACASPQGGVVSGGQAVISRSGNTLDIAQKSNRAVIDWNSFDVSSGETVDFIQPSSSSIALNRIHSANPTDIEGSLTANGQVILVNPNGIVFGAHSQVDVSGLVATTANIGNSNFMAGGMNFNQPGKPGASVVNQGTITAKQAGLVGLVAPDVENQGVITARLGKVALASGDTFTLDLYGDKLLEIAVSDKVVQQMVANSGTISADGGSVTLTAAAARQAVDSLVSNSGVVEAQAVQQQDGEIVLTSGGIADNTGTLDASAASGKGGSIAVTGGQGIVAGGVMNANGSGGGTVTLTAPDILHYGTITARGTSGDGGTVALTANGSINQTSASLIDVSGTNSGGSILISAGKTGSLYSSATYTANGATGGSIEILGDSLAVMAATLDASGTNGGGTVLIGGGAHGGGGLQQASNTLVNPYTTIDVDATQTGNGGAAVVWSKLQTQFYGTLSAAGGTTSGNGGAMEVSSGDSLTFGGFASAPAPHGTPGSLLLDPRNITISTGAPSAGTYFNLADPNTSSDYGANAIVVLSNNNIVVTDPNAMVSGITNAGAVYLFNGTTGALISQLGGSHAYDEVGFGGVTTLNGNANFVISNNLWNSYMGAVTWGSGTSGVSGIVSSSNSLVGSHSGTGSTGDQVGQYDIIVLSNGNYVVQSPWWNGGTTSGYGAITWGSGVSGVSGVVSSTNSLVGSHSGDRVGFVTTLTGNGNYVVYEASWNSYEGAVTWGSGASGVSGVVSSANSLTGSTTGNLITGDQVGIDGITTLSDGNYVVGSPSWSGGTINGKGAATWGSGTSGVSGIVSSTNSLVGSHSKDQVGNGGITQLMGNGNYVVDDSQWNSFEGAVTWGSGASGVSGVVSSANSLTGSTTGNSITGDQVGLGDITALSNGSYVVSSNAWSGGTTNGFGAATWGSGASGVSGVVSSTNSLTGSHTGDRVGINGIATLTGNGNYVVIDSNWNTFEGAVTWGSGVSGLTGVVSSSNSLVGSTTGTSVTGDQVGTGGITALSNGNYVVNSNDWSGGQTNGFGAVTWGSGTSGVSGVVSSSNSLVGSHSKDRVGNYGIIPLLGNGNFVVDSDQWNSYEGAVTWGSGTSGVSGVVSSSNSLVGSTSGTSSTGDMVGDTSLTLLSNGNYVVGSPSWSGGSTNGKGAATWGNGTSGVAGIVSSLNSLVGSHSADLVGSQESIYTLTGNGNYVVDSADWNSYEGAVTWGSCTSGVSGVVSSSNSLVGSTTGTSTTGDQVGTNEVTALSDGNYVVGSPSWSGGSTNGKGATTWGSGTSGVSGVVSSSNSLVGSHSGDQVGYGSITALTGNGNYVVDSSFWNNNEGAVTWGNGASGVAGVVSSTNSLVGSTTGTSSTGDIIGNLITPLANGNYVIESPFWSGGVTNGYGAVTWGSGVYGISGVVSSSNSLVGSHNGDLVGDVSIIQTSNGGFIVGDGTYNSGVGEVQLFVDDSTPNQLYANASGTDVTINTAAITAITDTGTAVILQANNNITLAASSPITTVYSGTGGAITFDAGRSILLSSNITTDGGALTLLANDTAADGVVNADRLTGAAVITMASGTTLNAGSGAVDIELLQGTGNTFTAAGNMTLYGVTGGSITAINQNASENLLLDGALSASGTGAAITLASGEDIITTGTIADTSTTGSAALSMGASRDIILGGAVSTSGTALAVTLDSDNANNHSGYVQVNANVTTNGGNVTIGGGNETITAGSGYAWDNGDGNSDGEGAIIYDGVTVSTGAGNIIINGHGLATTGADGVDIGINTGGALQTSSGNITINGVGGAYYGIANYASTITRSMSENPLPRDTRA